jgi:L-fucose isomerase-like protein
MTSLKIGYIPLAKGNWKTPELETVREEAGRILRMANANHSVAGGESLVATDTEALALLDRFKVEGVDVIVCHFITFCLGTIVPLLSRRSKLPLVLWSMPEPPMDGGALKSNSFCAANMNAHALWKIRAKYLHVHAPLEKAASGLAKVLGPIAAIKRLQGTRIGLVGSRVPGFYTSDANELLLRRELGVEIENITMLELVETAKTLSADKVNEARELLTGSAGCVCNVSGDNVRKGGALFAAFLELKKKFAVDSFSVKCWPEFSQLYGIYVCAVMGMLNDRGIMAGCEGDIYGTVTMILQNELTGGPPFFCDLISIDGEGNTGVSWHCGAAPRSLCRPGAKSTLRQYFRNDDKGIINEFPLKPGRVTLARLGETYDNNGYRMLIATGEAVETEQLLHGNPLRVRFDAPMKRLAETLIYEGFEHHFSVIHGEIVEELSDVCRLLDIEPVLLRQDRGMGAATGSPVH